MLQSGKKALNQMALSVSMRIEFRIRFVITGLSGSDWIGSRTPMARSSPAIAALACKQVRT